MEHDESSSVREESAAPSSGERQLSTLDAASDASEQLASPELTEPALAKATELTGMGEAEPGAGPADAVELEPPTIKAGSGEHARVSDTALEAMNAPEASREPAATIPDADAAPDLTDPPESGTRAEADEIEASALAAPIAYQPGDLSDPFPASDASRANEDTSPASEDVPTERAPNTDARLESGTGVTVAASEARNADSSASPLSSIADRDSVIPIESRDFVVDLPERQRRLPKAPTRPQLQPEAAQQGPDWLDELPHSSGTPTLAALVQRSNSESERPAAPSIPSDLLANHGFELGTPDWDVPLVRKPMTDAPVASGSEAPRRTTSNRASTIVVIAAVAAAAFAAGLSVRSPTPIGASTEPVAHRIVEPTPNIQAAKPALAVAPPEFAIEPAAPEQNPASLPLAEVSAKSTQPGGDAKSEAALPAVAPSVNATAATSRTPASIVAASAVGPAPVSAPAPAHPAEAAPTPTRAETAEARPTNAKQSPEATSEEPPAGAVFDARAAESAITAAASRAASCKRPGDPSGVAVVTITFSPTGRATTANVAGEPFAGTATGGCIAATLRGARVPAFSGDYVTVKKTVRID